MTQELEQVNPFDKNYLDFWIKCEHLGRYLFVKDFLKSKQIEKYAMDLACGFGYGTEILAEVCNEVTGIDNHPQVFQHLEKTFSQHPKIKIIRRNLETEEVSRFRFQHHPPNIVVCFETLEHLAKPEEIMQQFRLLLPHEGFLFISIPSDKFESIDENGNPVSQYHKVSITGSQMETMIQDHGFKILQKLGQTSLNRLMRWENRLYKKKRISEKWSDLPVLQEKINIYHAAYLFGYPDEFDIDDSYSRIYINQKI
ncbi:MAG: class I SAM-dependent methyltransferase [Candidatus Marinimicrobia bacterium]|nr:class I SAM-dependent methyltransferase [Candidatus Neomarinimicrobiota bacterium]